MNYPEQLESALQRIVSSITGVQEATQSAKKHEGKLYGHDHDFHLVATLCEYQQRDLYLQSLDEALMDYVQLRDNQLNAEPLGSVVLPESWEKNRTRWLEARMLETKKPMLVPQKKP